MEKLFVTVPEARQSVSLGNTKFYDEVKAGRITIVKAGSKSLVPVRGCPGSLEDYAKRLIGEALRDGRAE